METPVQQMKTKLTSGSTKQNILCMHTFEGFSNGRLEAGQSTAVPSSNKCSVLLLRLNRDYSCKALSDVVVWSCCKGNGNKSFETKNFFFFSMTLNTVDKTNLLDIILCGIVRVFHHALSNDRALKIS